MYFIFLLLFCINLNAMKKSDAIETPFTENVKNKATCAVFIDESNLAIGGQENCFIMDLITQKGQNINFIKDNKQVYNLCVNKDSTLIGFNTDKRPYLYNIQKKLTNSPSLIHYCGLISSLGFNTKDELTIYHEGSFTRFNEQLTTKIVTALPQSPTCCHLRENIFLCWGSDSLISMDLKNLSFKTIKIPCSCKEIFCSPQSGFIAIKNKKNKIYIVNIEKIFSESNFTAAPILVSQTYYLTAAFYPKNQFLALLTTNGLLEYRDYSKLYCVIKRQKVINENLNGWNFRSIHFSPQGTKVAVIINGKCMLLDVPLNIQYRNGWIIYFCFNKYNLPKEIFFIITDLISIVNNNK